MSWIPSLVSPLCAPPDRMRCKSPISSDFKFQPASPSGRPPDKVAPAGNPLMTMLLRAGYTSLPLNTERAHLTSSSTDRVRVIPAGMHPTGEGGATIEETESVYGLMMHVSQSLDVNCTYCHNTASFQEWQTSNPARTTAYHGIDMVRAVNQDYLIPLQGEYPDNRLGDTGDAPKANCMTCHQGNNQPLNGGNAVAGYPELASNE
jgi:photosynthetic reaction center cytochrome c subunit